MDFSETHHITLFYVWILEREREQGTGEVSMCVAYDVKESNMYI